jgi:putative ABC transport system ATP-binding protein
VPRSERAAAACVGVVKTYSTRAGTVPALNGIDAEFAPGAVTAVVGASGSGKSSLLRLLAGLDLATAGQVFVAGRNLAALAPKRIRQLRRHVVGYVFQRPADNFISYLTIAEHLDLAVREATAVTDPDALLEELGLTERKEHLPAELSGGEQQRAALAVALTAGRHLILADEPTAELDTASAADLLGAVQRLSRRGVAIILATHDANVRRIADDVLELDHGRVQASGLRAVAPARPGHHRERSKDTRQLLAASGLRKTYTRGPEQIAALDGVDLNLGRGRVVGLMGRSGSGKTTLLNVFAGWERPDAGAVEWMGGRVDLALVPWAELAIVPQKFGLFDDFTVRENVEYPARLARRLDELADRIETLIDALELGELVDRLPAETSAGQQQRVALARALVLSPRLVLADEPTGHQDASSARRVFEEIRRAAAGGTSCLVATHNEEAAAYFDDVYAIANGRLRQGQQ